MITKKRFRQELDTSISKKPVFNHSDKLNIHRHISNRTNQPNKEKRIIMNTYSFIILAVFSATIIFIAIKPNGIEYKGNVESIQHLEGGQKAIFNESLKNEIQYIKNNFYIGMSEEEVLEVFGDTHYEIILNESEDGTHYDIKYQKFLVTPFSQKLRGTDIDIENLKNGRIWLQVFVGMTWDKKAQRLSLIYLQDNKVMMDFIAEDVEETLSVEN